jgi:hypothetical protein
MTKQRTITYKNIINQKKKHEAAKYKKYQSNQLPLERVHDTNHNWFKNEQLYSQPYIVNNF